MRFYITEDSLEKGGWVGEERPGHKYYKREKLADGKYRYWYHDVDERAEAHTGRKHEHPEYRPVMHRVSDDVALPVLQAIGDQLREMQDRTQGYDSVGFSNSDVQSWGRVSAQAKADDPASMLRLRLMLGKYKRQISGMSHVGLDGYYTLGLTDAMLHKQEHDGVPLVSHVNKLGDLVLKAAAYIKDFRAYQAVNEKFGVRNRQMPPGSGKWEQYVLHAAWANFDETGYREKLAEIGIHLEALPERPETVDLPKVVPEAPPTTVDDVWKRLRENKFYKGVGVKWDREKNAFAFRFPMGPINTLMSNNKGSLGSITKWDANTQPWTVWVFDINTAETALAAMREAVPGIHVVADGLDEARKQEDECQAKLRIPIPAVQAAAAPGIELYPYQNEGVRFLVENDGNAMLGDEMGLGKTPQALAYGVVEKRRMVVVVPKNVHRNWVRESQKFFPGYYKPVELDSARLLKVQRAYAKEKEARGEGFDPLKALSGDDEREIAKRLGLTEANLASINYESVGKFIPYIKAAGFDTMIVDESHRMKDPSTIVSKTLTKLAGFVKHHILMSGTPIKNKREEFFTQFNVVRPGMFKDKSELTANKIGELWDKMRPFYLARQKRFVLKDLPDRTTTITGGDMPEVPTKPDNVKGYLHNAWALTYADVMEAHANAPDSELEGWQDEARSKADVAVELAKEHLEALEDEDRRELFRVSIGEHAKLTHAAAIAKVPYTVEFAQDLLNDSDSNVIVFSQSKVAAKLIAKKLGSVAVLHHGDLSDDAREAAKARFDKSYRKPDETARVFVSTIQSAKEGINLTAANLVIFNDLPWTAADVAQAEARAHRIGQDKDVNVYWLTAADNQMEQDHADIVQYKYILHRKQSEGRPLTPAEKVWMDKFVQRQDLLKLAKESEALPIKPDGATVAPEAQEAPAVAKPEVPKPEARPKSEYQIQHEREEAERKVKADAEEARRQEHYRASVAVTSPFAAQHIADVDPRVRPYFEKLHAMEATKGTKGAHMEIPLKEGSALARWFDTQRRAKNPRVSAGQVGTYHHFYSSPAGDLHLWQSWHGEESSWNLDYTTLGNGTLNALPPDRQNVLDELTARYAKPAPPPMVIQVPGAKEIDDTQHKVKEAVPAHEHTGKPPVAAEVKLEEKAHEAQPPKGQLLLFKSGDDLYFAQDDFDLCMSWAAQLTDAGDFDRAMDLIKGATHKYLRRYPSGKASPRWYYVYKVTSKHQGEPVQVGEKVKLTHEGQAGHYEVKTVHANGYVTMQHDETGHQVSVKQEHLHEMFGEEHKGAIDAAHARLRQTFEAAKKYGNDAQQARAREALGQHEERYQIKTPERVAAKKALQLTVLTHGEPSVENHTAAANAHKEAAKLGAPNSELHEQLAEQHEIAAKSRVALQASAEALKDPESRFHIPAEGKKAEDAPVLVLPKKENRGGKRAPKGAYFGSKDHAYKALKGASDSNGTLLDNFAHADEAYRAWKDGKGPKPSPMEGGDLDHLNQALGLEKPKRTLGKQIRDPRLTSPQEAWDRMVKGAKRWDSATTRHAIQVFQEWFKANNQPMHLPDAAHTAIASHYQARQDADYAESMGGEHEQAKTHELTQEMADREASFDPDKIEEQLDTSFDFGYNVEPEVSQQMAMSEDGPRALREADTRKMLKFIPRAWAQKIIEDTPGYSENRNGGPGTDTHIAAALKRAMTSQGVHVGKFLQEVRDPSDPALDARGNPVDGKASPEALAEFLAQLPKSYQVVSPMTKSDQAHIFVALPEKFVWNDDFLCKGGGPYVGPRGGLWADPKHTQHWDPTHHAEAVPSNEVEDKVKELTQLSHDELANLKKQQDEYLAKLESTGEIVPIAAMRLGRIIDRAIEKKGPRLVAKVPEKPARVDPPGPSTTDMKDEPVNMARALAPEEVGKTAVAFERSYSLERLKEIQEQIHEAAAESGSPSAMNWRTAIDRAVRLKSKPMPPKPATPAPVTPPPAPAPGAQPPVPAPVAKPEPPKMVVTPPPKRRNKKPTAQIALDFTKTAAASITDNPEAQALEDAIHKTDDPPVPVPEMKAPKAKAKPGAKAEPPDSKLVQTGDHIWGSRKDLADLKRIDSSDQLDGMNFDDAAYIVRKKHLVPAHDLDTLKGMGHTPVAANMALALLATIQAKPSDTDKARRDYVDACHNVVESVLNAKTGAQMEALCEELDHKIRRQDKKTVKDFQGYERAESRSRAESYAEYMRKQNPGKEYDTEWVWPKYGGEAMGMRVVEITRHPYPALGDRFARFVSRRGADWKAVRSANYYVDAEESKSPGSGWAFLQKKGQDKALDKAAQQEAAAARAARGVVPERYRYQRDVPEEVVRKGGRSLKDPDPKRIKETFNLKEVDYGQRGWMSEKDREYHTARLEEAFTDFSDVLGVSPKTVSFNGRLGVALGARGHGKAAAHYEPGRHVINITKFTGGGSLAHEWGHALDNIMASVHMGNKEGKGGGVYLTESYRAGDTGIPNEIRDAMREVSDAITKHPDPAAAKLKHEAHRKVAREKVNALVSENNVLVREHDAISKKPAFEDLEKRKGHIQSAIDRYAKELVTLTEKGKLNRAEQQSVTNYEFWIKRKGEELKALESPEGVRSEADELRMAEIKTKLDDLRVSINAARKVRARLDNMDPTVSHYYASAQELGEYWCNTKELFARAFESYVEDKMAKRKMQSTYLVTGTTGPSHTGKHTAHGPAEVYPREEERANIYTKMDALMDVLIKGGHLKKALEGLERIG